MGSSVGIEVGLARQEISVGIVVRIYIAKAVTTVQEQREEAD